MIELFVALSLLYFSVIDVLENTNLPARNVEVFFVLCTIWFVVMSGGEGNITSIIRVISFLTISGLFYWKGIGIGDILIAVGMVFVVPYIVLPSLMVGMLLYKIVNLASKNKWRAFIPYLFGGYLLVWGVCRLLTVA